MIQIFTCNILLIAVLTKSINYEDFDSIRHEIGRIMFVLLFYSNLIDDEDHVEHPHLSGILQVPSLILENNYSQGVIRTGAPHVYDALVFQKSVWKLIISIFTH